MAGHWPGDDAVTPVLGSILILAITVLGTTGILLWGAPTIQGIQDRNAMVAMEGEFLDLRQSTLVLRVVDSSRVPVVPVPDGEFGLEAGSRFAVQVVYQAGALDASCSIRVNGWHVPAASVLHVDVTPGCPPLVAYPPGPGQIAVRLDQILGGTSRTVATSWDPVSGSLTAAQDLSRGDWRVSLVDSEGDRHADAYILGTNRLVWSHASSVNDMSLLLEGGAVFRMVNGVPFLVRDPLIMEDSFGSGDYLMRMPTYTGDRLSSVTGGITVQAYLQLQGNHVRSTLDPAHHLRFTFSGDLAAPWCHLMLDRNERLVADPMGNQGVYAEDPAYPCEAGGPDGLRSVTYHLRPDPTSSTPFSFEFIHARVFATVTV